MAEMPVVRTDPTFVKFLRVLGDEDEFKTFLIGRGLMPPESDTTQKIYHGPCVLREGCAGLLYTVKLRGREVFRCNKCGATKSMGGGTGVLQNGRTGGPSFFYHISKDGRPVSHVRKEAVMWVVFTMSQELEVDRALRFSEDTSFSVTKKTYIDWRYCLTDLMIKELQAAAPIGGPGHEVQIAVYLIPGTRVGEGGGEGGRTEAPGIFAMVDASTKESRFFQVQRRDAATLLPIVAANIAKGTEIVSDEGREYQGIARLPEMDYQHFTVNHGKNRVDPRSRRHTQLLKRCWRDMKLRLTNNNPALLDSHLAWQWWLSLNGFRVVKDPFLRLCDLIVKHYPQ